MNKGRAVGMQAWNGMKTLIGDAKLAECHVRNAASFSRRNGMVKESHIVVKHASIQLAMAVPRHGLVANSAISIIV